VSTTRSASAQRPTRRVSLFPILFGVIVILGVVAVVVTRASGDDVPAGVLQARPVSVSGAALPILGDGADPAVGVAIPEVDGKDFAGDPVAIRKDGTPKLIVFLAHWCSHCQVEVPIISGWISDQGAPPGVEILSVSTAVSPDRLNYPPSAWLEREDWAVPVLVDDADGSVAQAFGLSAFPFFVAVDAGGEVVARGSGELDREALGQLVDRARNG
jgi:thiol-disulfide isomerase/thioredoxin